MELHFLVGFLKKKKKEKKSFVNIIDRLAFMYLISRVYFYPDVKHSKTLGVTRQACHNSVDVMLMYSNGCKVCFNFYQRIRKSRGNIYSSQWLFTRSSLSISQLKYSNETGAS